MLLVLRTLQQGKYSGIIRISSRVIVFSREHTYIRYYHINFYFIIMFCICYVL